MADLVLDTVVETTSKEITKGFEVLLNQNGSASVMLLISGRFAANRKDYTIDFTGEFDSAEDAKVFGGVVVAKLAQLRKTIRTDFGDTSADPEE